MRLRAGPPHWLVAGLGAALGVTKFGFSGLFTDLIEKAFENSVRLCTGKNVLTVEDDRGNASNFASGSLHEVGVYEGSKGPVG